MNRLEHGTIAVGAPGSEARRVSEAIDKLVGYRNTIKFDSVDDEAAGEYHAHLSDCIDGLNNNTMTCDQASESLGVKL